MTKNAVRKTAAPIDTMANFVSLVNNFITNNPLGCVSYTSGGQTIAGVVRGFEYYSWKIVYEDAQAKTFGSISVNTLTPIAFNTDVRHHIVGNAALNTTIGGTPSHDSLEDNFSCAVKCHDTNGENYSVTFKRDEVVVSSYEADSILTVVETWADIVTVLASNPSFLSFEAGKNAKDCSDSGTGMPALAEIDICGSDLFFDKNGWNRLNFVCLYRGEIVCSNPLHERSVSNEPEVPFC